MEPADQPGGDPGPRNLVVIGASAGGVETLVRVVGDLPFDLAASVCIVLHIAPGSPSALPAILRRAGVLPCRSAIDGEPLRDGEILVAPPDRHLVVSDGHVSLTVGPRENGHRPSVDVLFRTAAEAQDGKVIGVVLSGTRDDGTAGLAMIKAAGGTVIVQDPAEALYPGMPANALAHVVPDAVASSDRVAEMIVNALSGSLPPAAPAANGLVSGDPPSPEPQSQFGRGPTRGRRTTTGHNPGERAQDPQEEDVVTTTCPECGGVLSEHRTAGVTQWRCKVGHRYSPESLADAQAEGVEAALWAAVRALEDRQELLERMADQVAGRGNPRSASSFRRRAREAGEQAATVRIALAQAASTTLERIGGGETTDGSEASDAERRGLA